MKTNLILFIHNPKKLDLIYTVAKRAAYTNVAKYKNVAWAQLFNIPEEEREDYEIRILADTYLPLTPKKKLDYSAYDTLLGMIKWVITHGMPCQVTIQDTLETYRFEPVTNRILIGEETTLTHNKSKTSYFTKTSRVETQLGTSTWDEVEDTVSSLKRLHNIYAFYIQEEQHKTEFSEALLTPLPDTIKQPDITDLWEYCKVYAPAYGLDPIYMPITRESLPREWIKQTPGRAPLDHIHDEKARLSRVLQTLPIEYEAQVRTQYAQIQYYQSHPEEFLWLSEFQPCPECGRPVNTKPWLHLDTCSGQISETELPQCLYCKTYFPLAKTECEKENFNSRC